MSQEKSEGILLQLIPYLGQKKILKILTPEEGLISLLAKSTSLSPFCIAEWVYRKTEKELFPVIDATLLDPLLELRQSYDVISAAGLIAQDLLRTQHAGKKSPYILACAYLKKLPQNPPLLAASFRLRLLLHEGLFSFEPEPNFTSVEWEQVSILAFSRQFSEILAVKAVPFEKIRALFEERM